MSDYNRPIDKVYVVIEEVEFVFWRKSLKVILVKTVLNLWHYQLSLFSLSNFSLVLLSHWSLLSL